MDERRRFATALAGVAGLLAIAGGIATIGPRPLEIVPVPAASGTPTAAAPLAALPLPAWPAAPLTAGAAPGRPPRPRVARAAVAEPSPGLTAGDPAELAVSPPEIRQSVLLAAMPRVVPMRQPPVATSWSVSETSPEPDSQASPTAQPDSARRRGAVTGAFATAGHEVGAGLRTVGRTLKRLF